VHQSDWDVVRALPLFCGMSGDNFNKLTTAAALQNVPQHVVLFNEGSLPNSLLIAAQGSIELFCTHDGRETTIDIVRPVTTFNLAAVIRNEVYLNSARAITPAQVISIPIQSVHSIFDSDLDFARATVNELAERYCSVIRSLKNEKLRTSAERLANWILHADAIQGNQRLVELDFEKRTLASSLGMTPENLSRSLARLARYGVRSSGRGIVIEDFFALERFAKPNALIDG
jgi:CRP/FNR family transcriptional regulator, transcriptional activator FtrB